MRNVVLLCLDTVRKDFFDDYAPRIQRTADVEFGTCRAASSWSAPSHASMFTGKLPHEHGVHAYHRDFSTIGRDDTFLGALPDHRAYGASANVWAGSAFGFDGLFDRFSDVSPDQRFPAGIDVARFGQSSDATGVARYVDFLRAAVDHEHPLKSLGNGVLVQLDRLFQRLPVAKPFDDGAALLETELLKQIRSGSEPFFGFVNFMDAHGPYHHVRGYDSALHDAPSSWTSRTVDQEAAAAAGDEETLERIRGLYAASIDYLDRRVVSFAERLQSATERETTVVVTADHGNDLALTEERYIGHTRSRLTEPLLHVPLAVLNAPDGEVDRSGPYVSHLDLPELLAGLAHGETRDVNRETARAERIGYSGPLSDFDRELTPEEDRTLRCLYDGETKTVWDHLGETQQYRIDPARPSEETLETTDVDVSALDATFGEAIETVASRVRESGTVTVETDAEARLRDLGYL
jgi:arylsulfatase A-like enzyme